jgi:hypothetical protein
MVLEGSGIDMATVSCSRSHRKPHNTNPQVQCVVSSSNCSLLLTTPLLPIQHISSSDNNQNFQHRPTTAPAQSYTSPRTPGAQKAQTTVFSSSPFPSSETAHPSSRTTTTASIMRFDLRIGGSPMEPCRLFAILLGIICVSQVEVVARTRH